MIKILGIDVGTNSLGWALILANADNEFIKLMDMGVTVFPKGNNEDKSGKEFSRSLARTQQRGARRLRQRRKLIKQRITAFFNQIRIDIEKDIFFENESNKNSDPLQVYSLRYKALHEKISLLEIAQLLVYFNNNRGFKSNRKNDAKDSDSGKVKSSIKSLTEKLIAEKYETLGHYYFELIQAHRSGERLQERILNNYTAREMYVEELNKIYKKQQAFYPEILTNEVYDQLIKKGIFYQRDLKSQKHLLSKCTFEPSKRVAPKSHPTFQAYRLLTALHNIKINYADGNLRSLTEQEVIRIFDAIKYISIENKDGKYDAGKTRTEIKKVISNILNIGKKDKLTELEIMPLTTEIRIRKALGENFFNTLSENQILNLHHCLHFFTDDEKLKSWIITKYKVNHEQADKFADIVLEQDYASLSIKACNKLLPYLANGKSLTDAKTLVFEDGKQLHIAKNPNQNYQEWLVEKPISNTIKYLKFNELRNPVVQKSISECIGLINAIISKHGKPDIIRVELARELKKPRTERDEIKNKQKNTEEKREQYAAFLNAQNIFKKEITKFDSIIDKYQLWLELGGDDEKLKEQIGEIKKLKNPKDLLAKHTYWLECNRTCPYTGEVISLTELFSGKYEIEHILPYSRSLDDSQVNKTLSQRAFNKDLKGNKTPMEYFESLGKKELDAFTQRIAHFSEAKRERFLFKGDLNDNFTNNQITDNAYTAKLLKNKLLEILPQNQIQITKGGVTSKLRRFWGLNHLLHIDDSITDPKLLETLKNRKDHRHHALDAVVIACTSRQIVNIVNKHTHFYDNTDLLFDPNNANRPGFRMVNHTLKEPWFGFVDDVKEKINEIITNYRFRKRLVQVKINKSKHNKLLKNKPKAELQRTLAIRDILHAETVMGKNHLCAENQYIKTKAITTFTDFKQLENIVDAPLRHFLLQFATIHGIKALQKEKIQWPENHEGRILRNVKVYETSKSMIEIRSGAYVEPDNNYCIAIYEGEKEVIKKGKSSIEMKRDFEVVSFYKAVHQKIKKQLLFPKVKNELPLKMVLQQNDLVVMIDENIDEINWSKPETYFNKIYRVVKIAQDGRISYAIHNKSSVNTSDDAKPIAINTNYNINCIKIKINRLGEIIWRSDIGYINKI